MCSSPQNDDPRYYTIPMITVFKHLCVFNIETAPIASDFCLHSYYIYIYYILIVTQRVGV